MVETVGRDRSISSEHERERRGRLTGYHRGRPSQLEPRGRLRTYGSTRGIHWSIGGEQANYNGSIGAPLSIKWITGSAAGRSKVGPCPSGVQSGLFLEINTFCSFPENITNSISLVFHVFYFSLHCYKASQPSDSKDLEFVLL